MEPSQKGYLGHQKSLKERECVVCKNKFKQKSPNQKHCGSIEYKIGCSYKMNLPSKRKLYFKEYNKKYSKEYYKRKKNNPEFKRKNRERAKKWHDKNYIHYKGRQKERTLKTKILVFNEYGKRQGGIKCNCCGEKMIEFLCIDHINGGGSKHRKEIRKEGWEFYRWLKNNNFPEGYQLLCHNCNQGKHIYEECPHKK